MASLLIDNSPVHKGRTGIFGQCQNLLCKQRKFLASPTVFSGMTSLQTFETESVLRNKWTSNSAWKPYFHLCSWKRDVKGRRWGNLYTFVTGNSSLGEFLVIPMY